MLVLAGPRAIVLLVLIVLFVINAARHLRVQAKLKRLKAQGVTGSAEYAAAQNSENIAQYVNIVLISAILLSSVLVPIE